jgi:TIR domain
LAACGVSSEELPSSKGRVTARIFISYRRAYTELQAERLYDRLSAHFGQDEVFLDRVGIEPGEDFREIIKDRIGSAQVVLVLIDDDWLTAKGTHRRRLAERNDFVRLEIATALEHGKRVIPLLLEGADMPKKSELPASIADLAWREALRLARGHWRQDVDELIRILDEALKPVVPPWSVPVEEQGDEGFASLLRNPKEHAAWLAETASAKWAEAMAGTWRVRIAYPTKGGADGSLAIQPTGSCHGRMVTSGGPVTVAGRLRFQPPDHLGLEGESTDGVNTQPFTWFFELKSTSPTQIVGTNPDGGEVVWTRTS